MLISTSIDHKDADLLGGVRAVELASRYLIEPCGTGKSRLTHISRVDLRQVLNIFYTKPQTLFFYKIDFDQLILIKLYYFQAYIFLFHSVTIIFTESICNLSSWYKSSQVQAVVSLGKKHYIDCSVLLGLRNGFQSDSVNL